MSFEVITSYIVPPLPDYELSFIRAVNALALSELAPTTDGQSRVGDRDPQNLLELIQGGKAFAAIRVLGGPTVRTISSPTLDVDVFSTTQRVSSKVAKAIVAFWESVPILIRDDTVIINIETCRVTLEPAEVPYDPDRTIRRYYASMQLAVRR